MRAKSVQFVRGAARAEDFPRDGRPEVALLGRSNVGKSSLLNRLVGRSGVARVSKTPGRTRQINYFLVDDRWYLVDLPGAGYARVAQRERRAWDELVARFLEREQTLRLVLQLVDIRHEPMPADRLLACLLAERRLPVAVALTKADKIGRAQAAQAGAALRGALGLGEEVPVIAVSAHAGTGIAALHQVIDRFLEPAPPDRG